MSILTLLAGTHCWQHLEVPRYFFVLAACRAFKFNPKGGDEAHQRGKHCILGEVKNVAMMIVGSYLHVETGELCQYHNNCLISATVW